METCHISTLEELYKIAEEILAFCIRNNIRVITLQGDLGVGKTALTKELAKLLDIPQEITSPTFMVMKSYEIPAHPNFKTLTHIDAYRIESDDEMRVLRFQEIVDDTSKLICIEWPEKIASILPEPRYEVTLTLTSDGTRDITYGSKN
jgi:tRNA threonylcarbamoyladenosine biosynthesis protein TsaE